ncbi:hypothetical protein [Methylibium sp.]|uniref:hypothetical protein n=1 Tax=Methylibium sp. TaxID=2067992 RepID=UPI003D127849
MTSIWPGWTRCGNGLWVRPDGVSTAEGPPPWPDRPHRIAVIGVEGLRYPEIAAPLNRSHRHKPMTLLLHTPPPPDEYCVAHKVPGYVYTWAAGAGVELRPLPLEWPAGAADLVDGVINLAGDVDVPGVKVWRPYPLRRSAAGQR